jgi:hypothetical protein
MKKNLKKLIGFIALQCGMFLFAIQNTFADPSGGTGGAFFATDTTPEGINAVAKGSFTANVTTVINYFLGILGLIAVGFIIYAGVLMVTAGGNEDAIGKGRKIITYAVIGIVIILLSYTIVTFVTNALG